MIYAGASLPPGATLEADLCVIGSGAGGGPVATLAAEAGLRVVVLEAGRFLTPADFSQREEDMFPRLYWEAGGRTTADRSVKVHQGLGVGGSTLHNLNLCKRVPVSLRDRWTRDRGLEHLPSATWDLLYAEVEALLAVQDIPVETWNRHNHLLAAGAEALGWRWAGLRHNRTGCVGSGYCELGCAWDAKNNSAKVFLPRAVAAGAEVYARVQAVRIHHDGRRVAGVGAVVLDPERATPLHGITVLAPRVCLAASATGTPALLDRSGVPDPSRTTGRQLHLHPAAIVAGVFADPVDAWRGAPQTVEVTEHLDLDREDAGRVWIVPAFAHPVGTASFVPGWGAPHRDRMLQYRHLAAFTAMIHDQTPGIVRPRGDLGLAIDYTPDAADLAELDRGVEACAALLRAAGATEILLPSRPYELTAVHPTASVPMGDDPARAAVGSDGKHHHLDGLWIADGSLFPTSTGGPPQLTIYALGLHVGRKLVAAG